MIAGQMMMNPCLMTRSMMKMKQEKTGMMKIETEMMKTETEARKM